MSSTDTLEIVSIDISLNHDIFKNIVDETISDKISYYGTALDWEETETHLSKSGTNVYKISFKDDDNNEKIDLIAEKDNSNIIFKEFSVSNYNNSFYKVSGDMSSALKDLFVESLRKTALKSKGKFACIYETSGNNNKVLIDKGRDLTKHIKGIGIVSDNGKIYTLSNDDISLEENDDVSPYVPNYLMNDWLDENPVFQAKLQTVPDENKIDLMGQFAIYQKRKDMITADQFRDILIQVGAFADTAGGFKDETLRDLYQFFV